MKALRKLALIAGAAMALATPLAAQAAFTVCIDDAAGGFSSVTATCVADNTALDTSATAGIISTQFNAGGVTINTAFGEPVFGPGVGMSLSVDGTLTGSWIVAVSQTDLNAGAAGPTSFSGNFTGSVTGAGTITFELLADDNNAGVAGYPGTFQSVDSGGVGAISGSANVTDPFSMLALTFLNCTTGECFFSTDLTTTVTVPEPGSLALIGLGLSALGLGLGRRRRVK
jgi:hypothetical protein